MGKRLIDYKHQIPEQFLWGVVDFDGIAHCFTEEPSFNNWTGRHVAKPGTWCLRFGDGFESMEKPIKLREKKNIHDIYEDYGPVLDQLSTDWVCIAIDSDGVINAFQTVPSYVNGFWESSKDCLYLGREYHTDIEESSKFVITRDGLFAYPQPSKDKKKSIELDDLFEELREHLKVAKTKHPEFPNNKGFGLAAVTEEYLELTMALNDNESTERVVEEAKDTIITLIRLIQKLRKENDEGN